MRGILSLRLLLLVLALAAPTPANAAHIDLTIDLSGPEQGRLTARSVGVSLVGLALQVDGASDFVANPSLDLAAFFIPDASPPYAFLLLLAPEGSAFLEPGQEIVLGHFLEIQPVGGPGGFFLQPGGDEIGFTLAGPNGDVIPIEDFAFFVCDPGCPRQHVQITVPEPQGMAFAVALAALGFLVGGRRRPVCRAT